MRCRSAVCAALIALSSVLTASADAGEPATILPFSVSADSVTIVQIMLPRGQSYGADLAFLFDPSILLPDTDFIRSHAFVSEASAVSMWNIAGDTLLVSISTPYPHDVGDQPFAELAFRGRQGISSGTATSLVFLPYPFTDMNEHGLSVHTEPFTAVSAICVQNAPNPFNPATTIRFATPAPGIATVSIYDVKGRQIRRLAHGWLESGYHAVVWDGRDDAGRDAASGIYLCRVSTWRAQAVVRMTLVR
jgi:hypothetical protein